MMNAFNLSNRRKVYFNISKCPSFFKSNTFNRQNIQVRYYIKPPSSRRTKTAEEETQAQQTDLWNNTGYQKTSEPEVEEEDPNATTESAITPDVRMHLSKVYGLITGAIGASALGVLSAGFLGTAFGMGCAVTTFATVLGICFTDAERVVLRQNLLLMTGYLVGGSIGGFILGSAPGVVFASLLGTASIVGGFSVAALKAKRRSMLYMGGFLLGGLFAVFGASLASIILPFMGVTNPLFLGALYNVNIYGGLGLFSLFIAYDTQSMIERFKAGDTDHVSPALSMFLNIFQVFVRLLHIFGGSNK